MGYTGSIIVLRRYPRSLWPTAERQKLTVRYGTPPAKQAQADSAYCGRFADAFGPNDSVHAGGRWPRAFGVPVLILRSTARLAETVNEIILVRSVVGLRGVVATVRRILDLPFVPPVGTTLVTGSHSVVVKEVVFDVRTKQIMITGDDDRSLARGDNASRIEIMECLAVYAAQGWTVLRATDPHAYAS